jgi:hypothetical protein
MKLLSQIIELLAGAYDKDGITDEGAITALLLCEIRMLYKNNDLTLKVQEEFEDKMVKVHN